MKRVYSLEDIIHAIIETIFFKYKIFYQRSLTKNFIHSSNERFKIRSYVFKKIYRNILLMGYFLIIILISTTNFVEAQEQQDNISEIRKNAIRIFIDCGYYCDFDYVRKELTFVNYVRDRNDAQVFVLVTSQRTGSSGQEFTFTFIGKQEFKDINDTLIFTTKQNETAENIRKGFVRILKIGLIRYVSKTPLGEKLTIIYNEPSNQQEIKDIWDYWIFSVSGHGFFNGNQASNYTSLYGSLSANRTTEDLRVSISLNGNYNDNKYDYQDYKYRSISQGKGFNSSLVFSITDHWSWGLTASVSGYTYTNTKLGLFVAPGIEYNLFPYSESTRKQLRFLYRLGYEYARYNEETIYFKTIDRLPYHSLSISYTVKEPWGSISVTLLGSNYLYDFGKNQISIYGSISFRLIEGLSLDVSGNYSATHDQISLPKQDASTEDILLQRRELESQFDYYYSVGLSFSFGSIYNNIVNPRFGGS